MVPSVMAELLMEHCIEMTAVTDHNSSGNTLAFARVLKKYDIAFLLGMEISTREDVHVLVYFPDFKTLSKFEKEVVRPALRKVTLDPEIHGYQLLVDDNDEFIDMEEIWLGQSTDLSLDRVVFTARKFGALVVLSHIFRRFGVVYQLGFLPADLPVHGVEVLSPEEEEEAKKMSNVSIMASSDAHHPDQIGRRKSLLRAHSRSFSELKFALFGRDGRSVGPLWG
ncbi:MAG: hypothetical protein DRP27_03015 [Thermotogae bacterium]|nr:MAG: hypothetical protein DRP27_03015 [Thermotogota bacterium]